MSGGNALGSLMGREPYKDVLDFSLIEALRNKNFKELNSLGDKLNDFNFMQPLIYAYESEMGTYELFLHSGPVVQKEMAVEVFQKEPSLILETDLVNDKQFIESKLKECPQILEYIPEEIKNDAQVSRKIEELRMEEEGPDLTSLLEPSLIDILTGQLDENPDLGSDEEFMTGAIQSDPSFIELAAKELKENFDFMREQSRGNQEVIDLVAQKADEFNLDAISAVRESSRELTLDDCMNLVDQYIERNDDPRYQMVKDKIQECGMEDPRTMKWITAMVAQMDDVSPELMKKILDYSVLTMERTRRDLDENGKMNMDTDVAQSLIVPTMLKKLMDRAEENGVTLGENVHESVDSYVKFYNEFQPQYAEHKRKLWEAEHPAQSQTQEVETNQNTVPFEEVAEAINANVGMNQLTDVLRGVRGDAREAIEEEKTQKQEVDI